MRSTLFLILFIASLQSLGQSGPVAAPVANTNIVFNEIKTIAKFIDSLRIKLIADTAKFNSKNVFHSPEGIRNLDSYSSLFLVNIKYLYKLDIVSGTEVMSFINEMLVPEKIKSINVLNIASSQAIFGREGINGAILIDFKSDADVNYKIAGMKKDKENHFSNFGAGD